jgi:hypothetical protein
MTPMCGSNSPSGHAAAGKPDIPAPPSRLCASGHWTIASTGAATRQRAVATFFELKRCGGAWQDPDGHKLALARFEIEQR